MQILLNGTHYTFTTGQNLDDLVKSVGRKPEHVIAEVNNEIVKSGLWLNTVINDGDVVELVSFVGGG